MAKSSTASFDSCYKQCKEIMAAMQKGEFAPLYLLHGVEGYFIDIIEGFITKNALSEEQQAFNQVIIYGKESSSGDVISAARRYPMMSERQVVVVREAQSLSNLDDIAHYVAQPMQSTILVIAHRDKAIDKRSSLYKKIAGSKSAVVFESVAPREWELARFVEGLLSERGLRAEPVAVSMIADNIGGNLIRISSEIDKLQTRMGSEITQRAITATDIENNIGISKKFNNFELCKALSNRNFAQALRIADNLSADQKNNPLLLTIMAIFSHFQRITALGFLRHQSGGRPLGNDYEVARLIKLPNAYFLDEYQGAANNYPLAKSVAILGLLREWDLKSKGINAGSAQEGQLLRELLLRISLV